MTVCIGGICENGAAVVLASDTMVTSSALMMEFEHQSRKMTRITRSCIALTAGNALVHTELFGDASAAMAGSSTPSVREVTESIKNRYSEKRLCLIEETILKPKGIHQMRDFYDLHCKMNPGVTLNIQNQVDTFDLQLLILIAGVDGGRAHVYGIWHPGTSMCFDAIGFHAIGNGAQHALVALISRDWHIGIPLHEACVRVYDAKKVAEKAPGVGQVTDMAMILADGRIVDCDRNGLGLLGKARDLWLRQDQGWGSAARDWLTSTGVTIGS